MCGRPPVATVCRDPWDRAVRYSRTANATAGRAGTDERVPYKNQSESAGTYVMMSSATSSTAMKGRHAA